MPRRKVPSTDAAPHVGTIVFLPFTEVLFVDDSSDIELTFIDLVTDGAEFLDGGVVRFVILGSIEEI